MASWAASVLLGAITSVGRCSLLDQPGGRGGLAGAGGAEQHDVRLAALGRRSAALDRRRLVARRLEVGDDLERAGARLDRGGGHDQSEPTRCARESRGTGTFPKVAVNLAGPPGVLVCVSAISAAGTGPAGGGTVVDAATAALPADREAAITLLFTSYHRQLVGFAILLVDDLATAEDVVQDAFLGAASPLVVDARPAGGVRVPPRLGPERQPQPAARTPAARPPAGTAGRTAASAESIAFDHAEHDDVASRLATLPRRQREVLVLRYYLDQTEAEIARTLSISARIA